MTTLYRSIKNFFKSSIVFAICAFAGCQPESIGQYTTFAGGATAGKSFHKIIGDSRDANAFATSNDQLTEADWKKLEAIAPRAIWEQILAKKDDAKKTAGTKAQVVSAKDLARPAEPIRTDIPIVELPSGKIQLYYKFKNLGGVKISTTRDGGTSRRIVKTSAPDFAPVVAMINQQLGKNGNATALPGENAISIVCPAKSQNAILQLLAQVDKRQPQVAIAARVFEVSHDFDFQWGANLVIKHMGSGGDAQAFASSFRPKAFADAVDPINGVVPNPGSALQILEVFSKAGISVDMTFQALAETGLIKVVSEPRMTVASGQTGYMLAGQELPIQSAKISNQNVVTDKVTYKPVGVQLYITPKIVNDDKVDLHIVTAVTAVNGFAPLPTLSRSEELRTIVNPIIDAREAETSVTIENGKTLVIGGMRMIRTIKRESKVPGVGDIKALSWLFKRHRTQKQLTDLYFFVTPKILK